MSETSWPTATAAPTPSPAQESIMGHVAFLALAVATLVLAALLQTAGEKTVLIPGFDVAMPDTCSMRRWVGMECAGCGLTRSFIRMAHGDVAGAYAFHHVGPLFFLFVAAQVPYRGWQIWRARTGRGIWRPGWWIHVPLVVLVTLMMIRWVLRLVAPGVL